jgi:hypothetical protein
MVTHKYRFGTEAPAVVAVNAVPVKINPVVVLGEPFFVVNVIDPAPAVLVEASNVMLPVPAEDIFLNVAVPKRLIMLD